MSQEELDPVETAYKVVTTRQLTQVIAASTIASQALVDIRGSLHNEGQIHDIIDRCFKITRPASASDDERPKQTEAPEQTVVVVDFRKNRKTTAEPPSVEPTSKELMAELEARVRINTLLWRAVANIYSVAYDPGAVSRRLEYCRMDVEEIEKTMPPRPSADNVLSIREVLTVGRHI